MALNYIQDKVMLKIVINILLVIGGFPVAFTLALAFGAASAKRRLT